MTVLKGIRIIDFSWSLPGPYATLYLSDMGADVIKIEDPHRPEIFRLMPPLMGENSAAFDYVNRGKTRRAIDLKSPQGMAEVYDMLATADVLVEQFRPGAMDRLGLGPIAMLQKFPRLIYCSITGYGQTGPYRERAGHDINYCALAGVSSSMGCAGEGPPLLSLPIADLAGGSLHAVIGILAALRHRDATGEGQHVDISMTDALWAMNAFVAPAALNGAADPQPGGNMIGGATFYDYYETRDSRYLSVGGLEAKFRLDLCDILGRADLKEIALDDRRESQARFRAALAGVFKQHDLANWVAFFADHDVCVEPVLTISEAAAHAQFAARQAVIDVDVEGATQRQPAHPIRYSGIHP